MFTYIIRRLLLMIPTMIGITMVVFFTMALSPAGRTQSMMTLEGEMSGDGAEDRQAYVRKKYHLDEPVIMQYLIWINGLSPLGFEEDGQGNFGDFRLKEPSFGPSISNREVSDMLAEALPITILLNVLSLPGIYIISVISGIQMGRKRGGLVDIGLGNVYLALYSLPVMWIGVMAIGYLASSQYPTTHWFPAAGVGAPESDVMTFFPSVGADGKWQAGYLLYTSWHLILPVICMSYGGFAFLSKVMRTSILENISADYIRTARAKGVSPHDVLYGHVFRNSLIPLITISAGILPSLIGGSIVVEEIFSIPGMGKLALQAVVDSDFNLVMATTLIGGIMGMFSLLLADLGYALVDPRVSYE